MRQGEEGYEPTGFAQGSSVGSNEPFQDPLPMAATRGWAACFIR